MKVEDEIKMGRLVERRIDGAVVCYGRRTCWVCHLPLFFRVALRCISCSPVALLCGWVCQWIISFHLRFFFFGFFSHTLLLLLPAPPPPFCTIISAILIFDVSVGVQLIFILVQLLNPGLKNVEKQLWSGRTQRQSNRSHSRRFRFGTASVVWQCPQARCPAASAASVPIAEPPRFVLQASLDRIKITFGGLQLSQPREQHRLGPLCAQRHPACVHHPPLESAQLARFPAADFRSWSAASTAPAFKAAVMRFDSGSLPAPRGLGTGQNSTRTSLLFKVILLYLSQTLEQFISLD